MAGTPLYEDIYMNDGQIRAVADYIQEVDFHIPGATSKDFAINPRARYIGYMFQEEPLEAYAVGLRCTKPGMEDKATFIRVSRGQLLGDATAPRLPVNEPVLAKDTMMLHRIYNKEEGPRRHGVDAYADDEGLPGADMDLSMLEAQLGDIIRFHDGEPVYANQEILDLKIYWGTLLAGRYSRLKALQDRLSPAQQDRLARFEADTATSKSILEALGLPTFETLKQPKRRDG